MMILLAVTHSHADSVPALRIFFSICLVLVLFVGFYIFRARSHVAAHHYGARNLRLWQVIHVWILAIDLLVTMLCRL